MKYICVSLIVLIISLSIGVILNEKFAWIDIEGLVGFDIEDMVLTTLNKVNSCWKFFTGSTKDESTVDIRGYYEGYSNEYYVSDDVVNEIAKGLVGDYLSLKNEIIIYKDHNEYLRYEKELIDLIEVLRENKTIYEKEKNFYKEVEQIENITENEINDVKNIIKLYLNK